MIPKPIKLIIYESLCQNIVSFYTFRFLDILVNQQNLYNSFDNFSDGSVYVFDPSNPPRFMEEDPCTTSSSPHPSTPSPLLLHQARQRTYQHHFLWSSYATISFFLHKLSKIWLVINMINNSWHTDIYFHNMICNLIFHCTSMLTLKIL